MEQGILQLWASTGLYNFTVGQVAMIAVGGGLIFLAITKGFEPLLLIPIGFGGILANIPIAGIAGPDGLLGILYNAGIESGVFPLLIFMGVGAMTDFGPLLARPSLMILGAAAQFGIFFTLFGAIAMNLVPGMEFSMADAAAIAIIGGADGPTAIYVASRLAPDLLGAIAVAAYSYNHEIADHRGRAPDQNDAAAACRQTRKNSVPATVAAGDDFIAAVGDAAGRHAVFR